MTVARKPRIGILAGAFDPIHSGHIGLALQAQQAAGLDQVVFVPERRPRDKPGVTHYAHRVAMIRRALRPHPDLAVLETVDRRQSFSRSWPGLQQVYAGCDLVLVCGSDTALTIPDWQYSPRLLAACELIVGTRAAEAADTIRHRIGNWSTAPRRLTVLTSFAGDVSSSRIRQALFHGHHVSGLLRSVRQYASREWLYVSPSLLID